MPVQIRPASLRSDEAELTDLLRRHLAPTADEKRFRWLYRDSPHGEARVWLACDTKGKVVGAASAFPRRMYVIGEERKNWVLGDFCLDEEFRSLGPALQLQRACFEVLHETTGSFCYDFPSASMMAVYRRIGIQRQSKFVRWVLPIKSQKILEKFVPSKGLARFLSPFADFLLGRRGWKGNRACDIVLQGGACGPEFDALERELSHFPGIRTVRSAAYLNWRYLTCPLHTYEILTARLGSKLVGYIVVECQGEQGSIVDFSSVNDAAITGTLLAEGIDFLRERGVGNVSLDAGLEHPWSTIFERCGFVQRDDSPLVVYGSGPFANEDFQVPVAWHLMQGERDS